MLDPSEDAPFDNVISPTAARLKILCLHAASTASAQGNLLFPPANACRPSGVFIDLLPYIRSDGQKD